MKCMKCNKVKDNMCPYVPVNVIKQVRVCVGKPGFICEECLTKKGKVR